MDNFILKISQKDFDLDKFVSLSINNDEARAQMIYQMVSNPNIMCYYHCYYIIDKASAIKPDLFYPFWDEIADLLYHGNSYHRDIALTVLANMICVDKENLFEKVADRYFSLFNDKKFMTAQCFLKNIYRIIECKNEYLDDVTAMLLNVDEVCSYNVKQKALLSYNILCVFEKVYKKSSLSKNIENFIMLQINSISPKTKKKAKELARELGLILN